MASFPPSAPPGKVNVKASSTQGSRARRSALIVAAIACSTLSAPAAAQTTSLLVASASRTPDTASAAKSSTSAATSDSARAANRVFRRSDLRAALTFAVAGAALLPLDTRITGVIRSRPQGAGTQRLLNAVNHAAFPGAYVLGYSVYGLGLVTESAPAARVGLYTATAVLVSSHITDALKGFVGRARPWAATESDEFKAGQGFSNGGWTSFPSGHATVAFAAATAFVDASGLAWPHAPGFVAPLAYGAATSVAVARVYGQAHWASDVVAGAAVGTFTARFIVREAHNHPNNLLEKIAVHGALGLDDRGRTMLGFRSQGE
jgi:membrane-associated phospholipid phosphatase